jgi:hypothetical protein
MRAKILDLMRDIAKSQGLSLIEPMLDNTVLLDSGLDSLGFAILVARLEELLGYDPFSRMEDPIYPQNFLEFVEIYETSAA